jgi:hypothetical protein
VLGARCSVLGAVPSAWCRVPGAVLSARHPDAPEAPAEPGAPEEPEAPYPVSLLIMSKIGMYIATTMPPTMTPRNAIITGSISVSMPATAVSTSSS